MSKKPCYPIKNITVCFDFSKIRNNISEKDREAFLKKYPAIKKAKGSSPFRLWIQKKKKKAQWLNDFIKFVETTGLTPQELYDLNEVYGDTYAEDLLEAFQIEAELIFGKGSSRIVGISGVVKSFYRHFGKGLVKGRANYSLKRKKPKPKFTKKDLLTFTDGTDLQFQAMVSLLSTIPIRLNAFLQLKWREVKEVLEGKELPQIIIPFEYQKDSIQNLEIYQTSFVHSWAKKTILAWKPMYERITSRTIDVNADATLDHPLWAIDIRPYSPPKRACVEEWFLKRSKACGIKICPKDMRPYFNTRIRSTDPDMKNIMMAQTSRYNGAYIMEGHSQWENLREIYKNTEPFINPEYEERVKEEHRKLEQKLKTRYNLTKKEIEEIRKTYTMGLISIDTSEITA